jgi:GNAT superfamily N-acetyltransferase
MAKHEGTRFVLEAQRSRGIGARLMQWLAAYAREHDIGRIDLTTGLDNAGAQKLSETLGAERLEVLLFRYADAALERLAAGDG